MTYKCIIALLGVCVLMCSCKSEENQDGGTDRNKGPGKPGVINGREWSIAAFSDELDKGLTVDRAIEVFGDSPSVEVKNDITVLTYEVDSDDLYENGVRVTLIKLRFNMNKIEDVRFVFTTYDEL